MAYRWGIAWLNQVVTETTVWVGLRLWAIKQYQRPDHTVSAHWFDLFWGGGEAVAGVYWGNMSCLLLQPVSKIAATTAGPKRMVQSWIPYRAFSPLFIPSLGPLLALCYTWGLKTDDHLLRPCQRERKGGAGRACRWEPQPKVGCFSLDVRAWRL